MTFLLILLVVAVVAAVQTVRLVIHDGRGPQRLPSSFEDPEFLAPLAR